MECSTLINARFSEDGDIFPAGKLPFEPTPLIVPERLAEGVQNNKLTVSELSPAKINMPLLDGRLPVSGEHFVEEVRSAYEENKESLPYRVDYDRREKNTQVGVLPGWGRAFYRPGTDSISVFAGNEQISLASKSDYNGTSDTGKPGEFSDTLIHEGNHAWTTTNNPFSGKRGTRAPMEDLYGTMRIAVGNDEKRPAGATYSTATAAEYLTAAVTGFNTIRNVTGRKMNTPEEMHRALDEMEKDPKILDQFPSEGGRVFRDYLFIKHENPEAGDAFRNALARDCQYLAAAPKIQGDAPDITIPRERLAGTLLGGRKAGVEQNEEPLPLIGRTGIANSRPAVVRDVSMV